MHIVAFITDAFTAREILAHLANPVSHANVRMWAASGPIVGGRSSTCCRPSWIDVPGDAAAVRAAARAYTGGCAMREPAMIRIRHTRTSRPRRTRFLAPQQ